jgi:DNA polymerase III subunit gamma/tau
MVKALYRTYRSKSFDEVVGQEHITSTLTKAVKNGRISHAYLFTGPRGVGKTSVARILAHQVNNLPYEGEESHLDIIEIDAASNRRIDEIRELRDKVHTAPAAAKYKVYIIDEVHMLTREAFNALLKTLEEPPAHTLFILATTEAHKLPETIVSRTQRFNFHAVPAAKIVAHLAAIAAQENIKVDKEALQLLAEYGEGSFRDSISLLDQLGSAGTKVTAESVRRHLALPPKEAVSALASDLKANDASSVLTLLEKLKAQGTDATTLSKLLAAEMRQAILSGQDASQSLKLLRDLLDVPASPMPDESLEIALLEAVSGGPESKTRDPDGHPEKTKPAAANDSEKPVGSGIDKQAFSPNSSWNEVLAAVRAESNSVFSALKLAVPEINGDLLTLYFEFDFHKTKVAQANHVDLIGRVIESLSGQKMTIKCQVDKEVIKAGRNLDLYQSEAPPKPPHLQAINNIFGAAEMLES